MTDTMQYLEEGPPLVAPKIAGQPVSSVTWIDRDKLTANDYNPNVQTRIDTKLLKISILASGWTQPLVVRPDMEIIDGYHRWLVAADPAVADLTDGLIPIVVLEKLEPAEQRMATVRHNRARGTHHVLKMSELVAELIDEHGVDPDELKDRLGMDEEEVERLHDRGEMISRGSQEDFNKGWVPR